MTKYDTTPTNASNIHTEQRPTTLSNDTVYIRNNVCQPRRPTRSTVFVRPLRQTNNILQGQPLATKPASAIVHARQLRRPILKQPSAKASRQSRQYISPGNPVERYSVRQQRLIQRLATTSESASGNNDRISVRQQRPTTPATDTQPIKRQSRQANIQYSSNQWTTRGAPRLVKREGRRSKPEKCPQHQDHRLVVVQIDLAPSSVCNHTHQ